MCTKFDAVMDSSITVEVQVMVLPGIAVPDTFR